MSILSVETKKATDLPTAEISGNDLVMFHDGSGLKTTTFDSMSNTIMGGATELIDSTVKAAMDRITVMSQTIDNISISASSSTTATQDMTVDGYTCLGLVGYNCTNATTGGSGVSHTATYACYLNPDTEVATFKACNTASSAISVIKTDLYGLYIPE